LTGFYKITFTFLLVSLFAFAKGQLTITGTVYDSTKFVPVKDVTVKSTSGTMAVTDSNGKYTIVAHEKDSLVFIYLNKPTLKYAVSQVPNIGSFDIALHIRVNEKFKLLKEVKVYAKNHRQDSINNREQYAKIFKYEKPGFAINSNSYSGTPGVDLDELINIFRFKRNKQLRKMQLRLQEEEKEKFVDYRFNKATVRRVTRLGTEDLGPFMKEYRPDFEFAATSTVVDFYQYILNASYEYKINKEKQSFIDARFNNELVKMASGLDENELVLFMKKYRPGYEFAKNSSTQEFYQYIVLSAANFKANRMPAANKTDSSSHQN